MFGRVDDLEGLLISVVSRREFEKSAGDWLGYKHTAAIQEGITKVLIYYK